MKQQFVKKIPMRKCVITNIQYPKNELFRVVRTPEGDVVVDDSGKVRGHGVYLSKNKKVIIDAKNHHTLDKYLEVKVSDDIYDALLERLN